MEQNNNPKYDFKGQVSLVTGASAGIGYFVTLPLFYF
jgi:NAD(P)-dependent dehydrogenase (short-subunit alcohol dehydrogenase family)